MIREEWNPNMDADFSCDNCSHFIVLVVLTFKFKIHKIWLIACYDYLIYCFIASLYSFFSTHIGI